MSMRTDEPMQSAKWLHVHEIEGLRADHRDYAVLQGVQRSACTALALCGNSVLACSW